MTDKDLLKRAEEGLGFAATQLRSLTTSHPDFFPLYTENGKWKHDKEAWTRWCDGFLAGMLWIIARYSEKRGQDAQEAHWWRERAEHYSLLLEDRQYDRNVHDLGFVFWSSWKRWLDQTEDERERERIDAVIVQAGKTMGLRFNEKGKYLRSFVAPESCFIDIMMNVGIIFYAAERSEDEVLYQKALSHCLTTRRYLVRGDGSTAHEGIFDLSTGEFLRQSTHQGWRGDSSWARGQAWALYGFGTAYTYTEDERLLDTAKRCADFFIVRTPEHGVPPNDWEEPDPAQPFESSAAAIASSGLFQLAELTGETRYREAALRTLDTLLTPEFFAIKTPGWEGILKHGSYHERKGLGVGESVMWGEYFFAEALDKLTQEAE